MHDEEYNDSSLHDEEEEERPPHELAATTHITSLSPPTLLPPGIVPVFEISSLFCTVSAVGLTLLGTSVPLAASNMGEIHRLHRALAYFFLSAITVILYVFKMETCLGLATHLLLIDQALFSLWLLHIVLCPAFLQLAIKYGKGTGSLGRWTDAQTANMLLLMNFLVLSTTSLTLSLSLCFHPHHQYAPAERMQSRRQWLRIHSGGSGIILFLILLELFTERFNEEFMFLVPIVLLLEGLANTFQRSRARWLTRQKREKDEEEEGLAALPTLPSSPSRAPTLLANSTTFLALSELFILKSKRLDMLKSIFDSVSGTALTLRGVSLLLAAGKEETEMKAFHRLAVSIFMNFWASFTVVLYWSKMRRLFHFR